MPDDVSDSLLEQNHRPFLDRLSAGAVPLQEARSILEAMKVRLNLLQTLLEIVEQAPEFTGQNAEIEKETKEEENEIKIVELYILQREQSSN